MTSFHKRNARLVVCQTVDHPALEFASEHWLKTLTCRHIYEEYVIKRIFVKGILQSIGHIMKTYWDIHKNAQFQEIAYYATSLTKVLVEARSEDQSAICKHIWCKLNNLQSNHCQEANNCIGSSCNTLLDHHIAKRSRSCGCE